MLKKIGKKKVGVQDLTGPSGGVAPVVVHFSYISLMIFRILFYALYKNEHDITYKQQLKARNFPVAIL